MKYALIAALLLSSVESLGASESKPEYGDPGWVQSVQREWLAKTRHRHQHPSQAEIKNLLKKRENDPLVCWDSCVTKDGRHSACFDASCLFE
jgi:hypothetical protein